jgi:hypothetical protein
MNDLGTDCRVSGYVAGLFCDYIANRAAIAERPHLAHIFAPMAAAKLERITWNLSQLRFIARTETEGKARDAFEAGFRAAKHGREVIPCEGDIVDRAYRAGARAWHARDHAARMVRS